MIHMDFVKGAYDAVLILHFEQNRRYLAGSGRLAAAGDLLPVSFGLPFRLGIIIDIFVRMNEQPNRLLSFR